MVWIIFQTSLKKKGNKSTKLQDKSLQLKKKASKHIYLINRTHTYFNVCSFRPIYFIYIYFIIINTCVPRPWWVVFYRLKGGSVPKECKWDQMLISAGHDMTHLWFKLFLKFCGKPKVQRHKSNTQTEKEIIFSSHLFRRSLFLCFWFTISQTILVKYTLCPTQAFLFLQSKRNVSPQKITLKYLWKNYFIIYCWP